MLFLQYTITNLGRKYIAFYAKSHVARPHRSVGHTYWPYNLNTIHDVLRYGQTGYIIGKSESPFPVVITRSETVGDPKDAILDKNL